MRKHYNTTKDEKESSLIRTKGKKKLVKTPSRNTINDINYWAFEK